MPKILEITKYTKIKNCFKVVFDNDSSLLIDADTVVLFGLKKDLFVDEQLFKKISEHNTANRITSYAFYLISHKMFSKKGLTDKLLAKGFNLCDIEKVINRFCELNYINDENFAKEFIRYLKNKGKGPFYIKNELKIHGIDDELIKQLLSDNDEENYLQIVDLIKKKFPGFNGNDKNKVRKVAMFFQRRGFCSSDIAKAIKTCEAEILE